MSEAVRNCEATIFQPGPGRRWWQCLLPIKHKGAHQLLIGEEIISVRTISERLPVPRHVREHVEKVYATE